MHVGAILRQVEVLQAGHQRRSSDFAVPCVTYPGHQVLVRRLDDNRRPVSASDLHLLMHSDTQPGTSAVIRGCTGKPVNRFAIYVTADAVAPPAGDLAPPIAPERSRSV